jgi:hypothetical protein
MTCILFRRKKNFVRVSSPDTLSANFWSIFGILKMRGEKRLAIECLGRFVFGGKKTAISISMLISTLNFNLF